MHIIKIREYHKINTKYTIYAENDAGNDMLTIICNELLWNNFKVKTPANVISVAKEDIPIQSLTFILYVVLWTSLNSELFNIMSFVMDIS